MKEVSAVEDVAELVIFDCDGVLVDSEPLANRLLAELLSEEGLPTTPADSWATYRGRTQAACIALAEQQLGRRLPDDLGRRFDERFAAACVTRLNAIAGVGEAVALLHGRGMSTCVASSGSHEKMRMTLGRTGLIEHFEGRIFSASEVERSKPHPDIFLHAADRMKKAPENCCVVEDSLAGVEAAVAAGMQVLGFAVGDEAAMLRAAGAHTFGHMRELAGIIYATRP